MAAGRIARWSVAEAVETIGDGQTLALVGSGGGLLEPDLLIEALADRFRRTGRPRDLTLVYSFGMGDRRRGGPKPLAQRGLLRRVIGGHWGMAPELAAMALAGEIEAYNLPLGVLGLLYQEIAGGRPGVITKVGIGTFVDPRLEGGRLNARTTEQLVEVIELDGEEYLFYRSFPVDVAFLRGTVADPAAGVSLLREPTYLDSLAIAGAVRGSGGRVVVQVREVVADGQRLAPADIHIPRIWVDAVVEHPAQRQTYVSDDDPVYAGLERINLGERPAMPLSARKVIARRAATVLRPGMVGNVGLGIPDGVGYVLDEEGCADELVLTVEHGAVGGVSEVGVVFGAVMNFDARVETPAMIDFYHGGSLDVAFLGFAQMDRHGNVNVSRYGGVLQGSGGFVDIAQTARTIVFCGTFTAGGLSSRVVDAAIAIDREGDTRKFVADVDQITFSGPQALRRGQRVIVVTERAVFELGEDGLTLVEVMPGIDRQRDVLDHMEFAPRVSDPLAVTAPALLREGPFGLARWMRAASARAGRAVERGSRS